jgi:hypothetical protein
VSIFALLIKPVQRLCQYPLLYREVVRAMPAEELCAARSTTDEGRSSPAPFDQCDVHGVLALLDAAAVDANQRVRHAEVESRLWSELGGTEWRARLAETSPGASWVLLHEVPVEFVAKQGRVAITRSLSFQRRKRYGSGRRGKLFVFSTAVLLAKNEGGDGGRMRCMAVWALSEASIELREQTAQELNAAGEEGPPAAPEGARATLLLRHQGGEMGGSEGEFALRCAASHAAQVVEAAHGMRRGSAQRTKLASNPK